MKRILTVLLLSSCSTTMGGSWDTSIVFTDYGSASYSNAINSEYQKVIEDTGLKTADLLYTCHVKDENDPVIICADQDSPRRSRIAGLIKYFNQKKSQVTLRAYVDLRNQKWRAYWHPTPIDKGFESLQKYLVEMAIFADTHGVDQLIIGSELEKMTAPEYKDQWVKLIKAIKEKFKGKIIYAANGNSNERKMKEYQWVPFWSEVDGVGINHYPEYKGKITYSKLYQNHVRILKDLKLYAGKFSKPLYITEVGFPLAEKGIETPYKWEYPSDAKANLDYKLLNMSAFFNAAFKNDLRNIHLWRFLPQEEKVHPLGYLINDQATKEMIKKLNADK